MILINTLVTMATIIDVSGTIKVIVSEQIFRRLLFCCFAYLEMNIHKKSKL